MPRPVFVFGVSGATWVVIDRLLAEGHHLPNLRRLQEEGCRATLVSVRVPGDEHYRPQVAWATMATGCDPERHGITRFYHTGDDLREPSLWEIFQRHGQRVGVYGWPLDWPPRQTNGLIVPSHWARDPRTWPPELSAIRALDREQQEAERDTGGGASPLTRLRLAGALWRHGLRVPTTALLARTVLQATATRDVEKRALLLRHAKIELSADLFSHLCARFQPGFRSFHTFLVDFVCHRYWRYFEPQHFPDVDGNAAARFGDAVAAAYMRTDRILGRLLSVLPSDSVVAVVSEHGMAAEPASAEVGAWRYMIRGSRLTELIGLEREVVARPVARWVALRPREGYALPPDTAARVRAIGVETGLPLFQVYQHGEDEVVVKFNLDAKVARYRTGDLETLAVRYQDRSVPFTYLSRRLGRTRSAMHDERGILILSGEGIRHGLRLPDVRLVDVAPTLLAAAGLRVPAGLDGAVLDVFKKNARQVAPLAAAQRTRGVTCR
jgi:predicted AlkP superfamily phosphohydrolase/phosphomutase